MNSELMTHEELQRLWEVLEELNSPPRAGDELVGGTYSWWVGPIAGGWAYSWWVGLRLVGGAYGWWVGLRLVGGPTAGGGSN